MRGQPFFYADTLMGGSTCYKTQDFQFLCPGTPGTGDKAGSSVLRAEYDLGIEIEVAPAIIVGVTEAQCPGAIPVEAGFFDVGRVAGRHAAATVACQDDDRSGLGYNACAAVFSGTGKPLLRAGIAQTAGVDAGPAAGVDQTLGLAAGGLVAATCVFLPFLPFTVLVYVTFRPGWSLKAAISLSVCIDTRTFPADSRSLVRRTRLLFLQGLLPVDGDLFPGQGAIFFRRRSGSRREGLLRRSGASPEKQGASSMMSQR